MALALPGAEERSHLGIPDFRVRRKIFATLLADDRAAVRISPDTQSVLRAAEPATFVPADGVWGLRGWTVVNLATADGDVLSELVVESWRRLASKGMIERYERALTGSGIDH
jgi:hypothetical protein